MQNFGWKPGGEPFVNCQNHRANLLIRLAVWKICFTQREMKIKICLCVMKNRPRTRRRAKVVTTTVLVTEKWRISEEQGYNSSRSTHQTVTNKLNHCYQYEFKIRSRNPDHLWFWTQSADKWLHAQQASPAAGRVRRCFLPDFTTASKSLGPR